MRELYIELKKEIESFSSIIIHRHEKPDPDALGSQLGLTELLRKTYPEKNVYAVGEIEPSLAFLGSMDEVSDDVFKESLIIVCDTANTERISDKRFSTGAKLIKIDHHPNVDSYGDLEWVDPTFSSTSEMIVALAEELNLLLDSESALLLYAGIVGDTGRFRYPNTTPKTLQRTSKLVEIGIDQNTFYSNLHKRDLRITRLEGYILQHFSIVNGQVGYMKLTTADLSKFQVTANETSALVNCFSDVEGLKVWAHFIEDGDRIRVRLRSKGPTINQIAEAHQGGGHPMAAGATAYSWEEVDQVIEKLVLVSQ